MARHLCRIAAVALLGVQLPALAWSQTLPDPPTITDAMAAGARRMSGSEVQTLITGNTVHYVYLTSIYGLAKGSVAPAYFRDAKNWTVLWKNKPVNRLWWMEGDALCFETPATDNSYDRSGRRCTLFLEYKGANYSCSRDENICRSIFRVVPGNSERW